MNVLLLQKLGTKFNALLLPSQRLQLSEELA